MSGGQWIMLVAAALATLCAAAWALSALLRFRFLRRLQRTDGMEEEKSLNGAELWRDLHAMALYLCVTTVVTVWVIWGETAGAWAGVCLVVPAVMTAFAVRSARGDALRTAQRIRVEQRAAEVLRQADSAPNRWAQRLTPAVLPDTPGYEIGIAHQASEGVMSGDLLDVFTLPSGRVCVVVGDVSGHDVEASITALQTKYILRSYLRRYRDPGQALEELNRQFVDYERPEEFMTVCVAVFDREARTVRYASAGHPRSWVCRDREVGPMEATGPALMLDPLAGFYSREFVFLKGDLVVMLTDGLAEIRIGREQFGEERIAGLIRKHADATPAVLCKSIFDATQELSFEGTHDDMSIVAIRSL